MVLGKKIGTLIYIYILGSPFCNSFIEVCKLIKNTNARLLEKSFGEKVVKKAKILIQDEKLHAKYQFDF
jgi:hypothetical protein